MKCQCCRQEEASTKRDFGKKPLFTMELCTTCESRLAAEQDPQRQVLLLRQLAQPRKAAE